MSRFFQALRPLLSDFLSTIVFAVLYAITHDIYISVGSGIAVGVAQTVLAKVRGKKIETMQWASLALVVVLGGASMLTADPRFIMIKPSIGGAAIGTVMMKRGWQVRYMPAIVTESLSAASLEVWGYIWAALVYALMVANLVVAFAFTDWWLLYTAFVPISLQLGLFLVQYLFIRAAVVKSIRTRMNIPATGAAAENT